VAGHGAELADFGIDHRKQLTDVGAENAAVFIENVVRAGAQADRGRDMPLMVFEDDFAAGPDDEGGVEPAVRKFRHLFDHAAAGDVRIVFARFGAEGVHLRPRNRDGLFHEAVDAVLALARRGHSLQEVLGQHDQAGGQFPGISHAEIDQVADAVQVLFDGRAILRDDYVRLNDQRRVFGNFLCRYA
jgi:hypothetical protein